MPDLVFQAAFLLGFMVLCFSCLSRQHFNQSCCASCDHLCCSLGSSLAVLNDSYQEVTKDSLGVADFIFVLLNSLCCMVFSW